VKIVIEKPKNGEEEQVIVRCHNLSPELLNVLNAFKSQGNLLIAYVGNEAHRLSPSNVLYIETVDNKTFLYNERDVFESKQKLYEFEELAMPDFMRISKSTIVNLSKIKSLTPAMNARLKAVLANGEILVISRQYVQGLKKKFGL